MGTGAAVSSRRGPSPDRGAQKPCGLGRLAPSVLIGTGALQQSDRRSQAVAPCLGTRLHGWGEARPSLL